MKELVKEGRVSAAGLDAFRQRTAAKTGIYSYENRKRAVLGRAAEKTFRTNRAAWEWFNLQGPGYRQMAIWWVVGAKRRETQEKRLATLIADSAAKQKIRPLRNSAVK
jgi:uncharacterized protein YdeI (YjbR/CyaY-like superfamily)